MYIKSQIFINTYAESGHRLAKLNIKMSASLALCEGNPPMTGSSPRKFKG